MKRINSRSFPFLVLLMIHSTFLIFTFYKKQNRKSLFILLLSNIGFAYFFEFFVLNLFHSYEYKPRVLKKRFLDSIFGAFLSQAVFLPFTSIFITAFGYGWKVKGMFALYFSLIERLFIKLGIFHNHWWRTIYTIILIPIYFKISDFWYKSLVKGNAIIRFQSLFMVTWVTGLTIKNIFAVMKKLRLGTGLFYTWKEHFIFATLYLFALSLISTCSIKNNCSWYGRIRTFSIMKIVDWFVVKKGIMKYNMQSMLFNNGLQLIMIYLTVKYKKWIYNDQIIDIAKKEIIIQNELI